MNIDDFICHRESIVVIGLGYVGLPLAVAFSSCYQVVGFDINPTRVNELQLGIDNTLEISSEKLDNPNLQFTITPSCISEARFIVVTVPTPIDSSRQPDLGPLLKASLLIGRHMVKGSVIIYESTVYPGCTEDECVPVIERESGLKWKEDFAVGYSPERINPGDKEHTVEQICKVVSGDSQTTLDLVAAVYDRVIHKGIHCAPSIKVAEASKVIENTQRDINIALMNELAMIFDKMSINTLDVLRAAGTKWNFLPFKPGLVGGHCIGVDPYYLTFKAQQVGYYPEVILAGRRINDSIGKFIAEKTIKKLIKESRQIVGSKVLILGWTFKENVPDTRNTRVVDIYLELKEYGINVFACDPFANPKQVEEEYCVDLITDVEKYGPYDVVVLAVKHQCFVDHWNLERIKLLGGKENPIVIDVKGFFPAAEYRDNGLAFWQL
jgi:UDP-N-acetyl-D-galactosamine dehydrogenase